MKITDKIKLKIIKALIKADYGFTYTGVINGVPVQFYCQQDTGKYLLGMKTDFTYYWEPGPNGWIAYGRNDLPWGQDVKKSIVTGNPEDDAEYISFPAEPVVIPFIDWINGVGESFGMGLFKSHVKEVSSEEIKEGDSDESVTNEGA